MRSLNKESMMSSNNRKKPYGLLLLVALGAALLSVIVLHKLRERRVLGLLVEDRERQLLTFHILLKKEGDKSKEFKSRLDELRDKTISLSHQKDDLYNKLIEKGTTIDDLKRIQKEMEASLEGKEEKIYQVTELLKQKEAEIEEMKRQILQVQQPINSTALEEIVSNVTTDLDNHAEQNENLRDRSLASTADTTVSKSSEAETYVGNANDTATGQQVQQLINSTALEEIVSNVTTDLDNNAEENENLRDRSLASTADPTDSKSSEAGTYVGNANDTATGQQVNSRKDTWVRLETIIEEDQVLKEDSLSSAEDSQDNSLEKIHVSKGIEDTTKGGQVVKNEEQIENNFATGDSIPKNDELTSGEMEVTEAGELKKIDNSQLGNERTEPSTDGVDSTIAEPRMKRHRNKRIKTKRRHRPIIEHDTVPRQEKSAARAESVDSSTVGIIDDDSKEQVVASDQPQRFAQLLQDSTNARGGNSDEKEETNHPSLKTISQDEKSVTTAETVDSSTVDLDSKEQVLAGDQPWELAQLKEDPTGAGSSNSDEKEETILPSEQNSDSKKDENSIRRAGTVDSSTVDFDIKEQVSASDQPPKPAQLKEDSADAGSSDNGEKEETIHPSEHNTVPQKDEKSVTKAETEDSSTEDFDDSKEQAIASDHTQQVAQLTEDSTNAGSNKSDKKEEIVHPSATSLEMTTSHDERQAAE